MHTKDARAIGDTEQRIYSLPACARRLLHRPRARRARVLRGCHLLADGHVPDEIYDAAASELSEQEIAALVSLIVAINAWTRSASAPASGSPAPTTCMTSRDPRTVAFTYFEAWKAKDFDTLRSLLADDASFRGPLGRADTTEECLPGLRGMSEIVTDIVTTRCRSSAR